MLHFVNVYTYMHPASVMTHPAIPYKSQLTVRLADLIITSLTEHGVVLCYLHFLDSKVTSTWPAIYASWPNTEGFALHLRISETQHHISLSCKDNSPNLALPCWAAVASIACGQALFDKSICRYWQQSTWLVRKIWILANPQKERCLDQKVTTVRHQSTCSSTWVLLVNLAGCMGMCSALLKLFCQHALQTMVGTPSGRNLLGNALLHCLTLCLHWLVRRNLDS